MVLNSPIFAPLFNPSLDVINSRILDVIEGSVSNTIASSTGSITDSVSIWLAVTAPITLDHGDGNETTVSGATLTEYIINYVGAVSPVIKVDDATKVIAMKIELGSAFTIDFASVSNEDQFTSLKSFDNSGPNKANTIGNPFDEFIDIGDMTLNI